MAIDKTIRIITITDNDGYVRTISVYGGNIMGQISLKGLREKMDKRAADGGIGFTVNGKVPEDKEIDVEVEVRKVGRKTTLKENVNYKGKTVHENTEVFLYDGDNYEREFTDKTYNILTANMPEDFEVAETDSTEVE